jgi:hypothetical protein
MNRPKRGVWLIAIAVLSIAAVQSVPSELAALAKKARIDGSIARWCRGEFRAGRSDEFAVAVNSPGGGGRYLVLQSDATVVELASFSRGADLSCYSRAEAQKMNSTIARSATIEGQISPRWNTTVICAFVDNTTSVCWQHSPTDRKYVRVGGWVT